MVLVRRRAGSRHRMRIAPGLGAAVLVVAAMMAVVPSAWATSYSVTDLGTLGGPTSQANAINNVGEVTGSADASYDTPFGNVVVPHAFRFRDGLMTDLVGVPPSHGCDGCSAGRAINESGQVAGWRSLSSGDRVPATWKVGEPTQIVSSLGFEPAADGINN